MAFLAPSAIPPGLLPALQRFRESSKNKQALFSIVPASIAENIAFCDEMAKVNRKGKAQRRCLVVSSLALYNFKPGSFKEPQRRIGLHVLSRVLACDDAFDVVVQCAAFVPEYDYHFAPDSPSQRLALIDALKACFYALTGEELPVVTVRKAEVAGMLRLKAAVKAHAVSPDGLAAWTARESRAKQAILSGFTAFVRGKDGDRGDKATATGTVGATAAAAASGA